MKLVSIIMNCKNGSKFLKGAISSIINQSYKNWEIIFFDNHSIDNSKSIVELFNEPRIIYHYMEGKNSLSKNRYNALLKANGDYIAFLDTDDIWMPNHLENLVNLIKENDEFVYSKSLLLKDFKDKKILKNISLHNFKYLNTFENAALNRDIFFGSILVNKNIIQSIMPLPMNLNHSIDDYIILSIFNICKKKIHNTNNETFIYRIHSTNLTNFQKSLSAKESIEVLNLIEDKQNIKINDIVFKERYYKQIILNFSKNNLINSFLMILKSNFFIFIFFFMMTILKRIKRLLVKVENQEKIFKYLDNLEI